MTDFLIDEFLDSYAEYMEWPERGFDSVARKLCERYIYDPVYGREFILIAFGWIWGRSKNKIPYIDGNCQSALLKFKLDEVYAIIAKENGWDN